MTHNSLFKASAEAVFGSASRGQSDSLSDRDILIVDDDRSVLRRRTKELESEGWSVAPYTFAKLHALSERGALFVQHIKLEATICSDDGRLSRLLEEFKPLSDYAKEITANSHLAQLASCVPQGCRGSLFAADVLYVSLRNFGVLWLASKGRYVFGYESILAALCEEGVLEADTVSSLLPLRFLKCLYRGGEIGADASIQTMLQKAVRRLPSGYFPSESVGVAPSTLLQFPPPIDSAPPYLILRELERRLIAAESLLKRNFDRTRFAKLERWIVNPRAYSMWSAKVAPELRSELEGYIAEMLVAAPLKLKRLG